MSSGGGPELGFWGSGCGSLLLMRLQLKSSSSLYPSKTPSWLRKENAATPGGPPPPSQVALLPCWGPMGVGMSPPRASTSSRTCSCSEGISSCTP